MNEPRPALVSQRAVQPLPRWALLLFCAAWVVPGVFGRDPWRGEDVTAFGVMSAMAQGRTSWTSPSLGGLAVSSEPLPHWLGAGAIWLLGPWLEPALAARLPFAALLALTLGFVWYAAYHLARTEVARPVAFAFGGEANPVDYARAIADGAVLALISCLGLLQLGHETTPELMQLLTVAVFAWAISAAPSRAWPARLGAAAALPLLAGSGAPTVSVLLGLSGIAICAFSTYASAVRLLPWVAIGTTGAAALSWGFELWAWRLQFEPDAAQLLQLVRQWAWFLWPAWLFALWTLWQWRRQSLRRHIAIPGSIALCGWAASVGMGGDDRALMLALPGLALLAPFALPTMRRRVAAAVDWFSVFFFSACILFIWSMYVAMQTGSPSRWAANITKLQPGFEPSFSAVALAFAIAGTAAWIALVRWRTGRSRHPLWKSLVLPAGGVGACWLLLMTLWLPLLDHARSPRPLVERGLRHVGHADCIAAPGATLAQVAALEVFGRYRVDATASEPARAAACEVMIQFGRHTAPRSFPGWGLVAAERRTRDSSELMAVYRRLPR